MEMTSRQMLDAVDEALAEVSRRLESGELDHSGRYYSDEDLADHAAIRGDVATTRPTGAPAARAQGLTKALTR